MSGSVTEQHAPGAQAVFDFAVGISNAEHGALLVRPAGAASAELVMQHVWLPEFDDVAARLWGAVGDDRFVMIGRTLGVAYTGETANALLCLVLPRPVLPPCLDDLLDLTRMLTRAAFPPAPEAPPSPDVSAAFDAVSRAPDPRAVWQRLLEQFNGNKRAIARFFNIDHKTVYTRLEQCGLHKRREEP